MREEGRRDREGQGCGVDLGVEHDGAEDAGVVHGLAEAVEGLLVVLVGAVGEVEARDVHPGAEQLLEHGHGAGGRAERADELGPGRPRVRRRVPLQVRQHRLHVDVRHLCAADPRAEVEVAPPERWGGVGWRVVVRLGFGRGFYFLYRRRGEGRVGEFFLAGAIRWAKRRKEEDGGHVVLGVGPLSASSQSLVRFR